MIHRLRHRLFSEFFLKGILLGVVVSTLNTHAEELVTQSYDISAISELEISGTAIVEIVQDGTESLLMQTEKSMVENTYVDLTDSRLTLGLRHVSYNITNFWDLFDLAITRKVRYFLHVKNLRKIQIKGASSAQFSDWSSDSLVITASGAARVAFTKLESRNLSIELNGNSKANIGTLLTDFFDADMSGASRIDLGAGARAHQLELKASGASHFRGRNLRAERADVKASGASTIELFATKTLIANASGASKIRYEGDPIVKSKTTGTSQVTALRSQNTEEL